MIYISNINIIAKVLFGMDPGCERWRFGKK